MAKRTILLLVLAGCHGPADDGVQRWIGSGGPFESVTPWERDARSGLAVRLLAQGPHPLGQPIVVALEVRNFGERAVYFDRQGLGHLPYELVGPGGRKLPCVGRSAYRGQTMNDYLTLEPGAERELERVDLAQLFAVLEPGRYAVRFTGLGKWGRDAGNVPGGVSRGSVETGVPESPPLAIDLGQGTLGLRDRLLQRLLPLRREGWVLYADGGPPGAVLAFHRSDLDREGRTATIRVGCESTPDEGSRALGACPWGKVWLGRVFVRRMDRRNPEDERWEDELSKSVLPGLEADLRKALEIRP